MRKALSIYLHIPFCKRRCSYCDFVSCCETEKIDDYIAALCNEIMSFANPHNYIIKTIYIGGGTPSVLSTPQITTIFDTLRQVFTICEGAEISIECNPNSLSAEKLKCYKKLGVNRLSIGVQSFDDTVLKILWRLHNGKQALNVIKLSGKYFDNISIDLMVGVSQNETFFIPPEIFNIVKHISVYSLITEPNTKIAEMVARGDIKLPTENEIIKNQNNIARELKKHGFHRYEVSNYAKHGAECQHNKVYWYVAPPLCKQETQGKQGKIEGFGSTTMTEQTTHFDKAERSLDNGGGNYVGFGAAAHSLLNNVRYNNTDDIDQYITACDCRNLSGINVYTDDIDQYITACGRCVTWHERTPDEIRTEQIMLGLRTTNGIPYDLVADKTTEIQFLQQQKLIKIKYGQVIATAKGFRLLNQIILKLV